MAAVAHIGFSKLAVFSHVVFIGMPFCFILQNFAEIGQLVDELWPKKAIFNMAAVRHLEF